jgi:photosystem II stability/assembly factor-like uncharacterized protein
MHMKSIFLAGTAFLFLALAVHAQTTVFTYQGQLTSNNVPAAGVFDLRFQLYNANSNVVAGPLTNAAVGVTNGLFIVPLDFGATVLDGSTRTLEIGVRTNGSTNAYIVLSPRQLLTSVPYAIQSLNASNAVALTAPLQTTNLSGTIPNSLLSTNVAVLTNNVIFSGNVTASNFTGNGYWLSNVPATSLTGTLPDTRLSANVALQSNPNLNFAGIVSATNFTGAGHGLTNVPGAFFWVTVAGTSSPINPNVGYIANNNTAAVTLMLPLSPSIGDVYKVAGVGAGGWIIAQNAGQMIAAGNLSRAIGESWKVSSTTLNWSAVASSADGTKLVATIYNGNIYTSANSGASWVLRNSSPINLALAWSSVASSADGTKLVATVGNTAFSSASGYIYTSADSGATWTLHNSFPISSALAWSSVASSADGNNLVAVAFGDQIYTSANAGSSWTKQTTSGLGNKSWTCVASSESGTELVAAVNGGYIYTSSDSGVHWTYQSGSGNGTLLWSALASSSDGANLIAATTGSSGRIYTSSNFGTNWTVQTVASIVNASWSSVASSADGSHLAAVYNATAVGGISGNIFTSDDFGATWTERNGAPLAAWSSVASSADGSQLAATATTYGSGNNSGIYISSQGSTTTGAAGYLIGPQHSAIELIYVGNNLFLPLSHEGTIRAY